MPRAPNKLNQSPKRVNVPRAPNKLTKPIPRMKKKTKKYTDVPRATPIIDHEKEIRKIREGKEKKLFTNDPVPSKREKQRACVRIPIKTTRNQQKQYNQNQKQILYPEKKNPTNSK